jgi:hypothetical protein
MRSVVSRMKHASAEVLQPSLANFMIFSKRKHIKLTVGQFSDCYSVWMWAMLLTFRGTSCLHLQGRRLVILCVRYGILLNAAEEGRDKMESWYFFWVNTDSSAEKLF